MPAFDVNGTELQAAYDVNGTSLTSVYDINGTEISFEPEVPWLDTAVITALPTISVGGVKQGGCTDGTYIYQCSGDSSGYSYMDVIKYKITDGTYTTVRYSGTPNFGHANDMTYNPNMGYLYICTMLSDGSVIVLNASDLSYVDTIYVNNDSGNPFALWQICYDRTANAFYTTYLSQILKYDSQWDYVEATAMSQAPTQTQQGCETDGAYYYLVTYNQNLILVYALDGTFVKSITNPVSGEPESLMYDWNDQFYFSGYNTPSLFYRIELKEQS